MFSAALPFVRCSISILQRKVRPCDFHTHNVTSQIGQGASRFISKDPICRIEVHQVFSVCGESRCSIFNMTSPMFMRG